MATRSGYLLVKRARLFCLTPGGECGRCSKLSTRDVNTKMLTRFRKEAGDHNCGQTLSPLWSHIAAQHRICRFFNSS
eukprot:7512605-Heterocapsa_arctica.AAC.1